MVGRAVRCPVQPRLLLIKVGDRLVVGQRTLTPFTEVRILGLEPCVYSSEEEHEASTFGVAGSNPARRSTSP